MTFARQKPVLVVISAVCLAFGLGWVVRHRLHPDSTATLRILCAEDWLDAGTVDGFARAHGARVEFYTYADVGELLRQLANADGRVDVLCTSSLLLKSLVRGQWIKRTDFAALKNAGEISADFLHLPYDPHFAFGVPVHWTAFGYYSARPVADATIKQLVQRGRVGVWPTPLNYMALLTGAGVQFEERLESEDFKRLQDEVHRFVNALTPVTGDAAQWLKRYDVAHVPASRVPAGTGFFAPGEDGGIVDVGLLAIGERATQPELGRLLIDELIAPGIAIERAVNAGRGAVARASEGDARLKAAQRPSALRAMPLTKMRFPDVDAEATLKFFRLFKRTAADH